MSVLFYRTRDAHGFLSNLFPSAIVVDGKRYATVEHYFQSAKYARTAPDVAEAIRKTRGPLAAKRLAWAAEAPIEPGWANGISTQVMRRGLEAKFAPGSVLAARLLETGDAPLVEHTKNDRIWGDGGDGTGENRLGKLLVFVRDRLRAS